MARGAVVPVLEWSDCGEGFECADAEVPLDYDEPETTITLALIKRRAEDSARRIGSLLVNPGGPGESAVDFVRAAADTFGPEVRARFDIVGMDPRGVGGSTALQCFPDARARATFFSRVVARPSTPAEEQRVLRDAEELGRLCQEAQPELIGHLSTANIARDLFLLMRAVGDEQMNYVGLSYGTYLGVTFANLFPDRVRTLVLDGVVDPVAYSGGSDGSRDPTYVRNGNGIGSVETLAGFLRVCGRVGPSRCAFAEGGDPQAKFAELDDRLRREAASPTGPDAAAPPRPSAYSAFADTTLTLLYDDATWPDLATYLQDAYANGIPTDNGAPALPENPAELEILYHDQAAQEAIQCSDSDNPRDASRWPALAAEAEQRSPLFGTRWVYQTAACATWPVRDDDRYTGPFDAATAGRPLVIGTRFDPATPYRNAEALAASMPGAQLVTLEGFGHVAFGRSACVTAATTRYLVTATPPAADPRCDPDRQPFDPPPEEDTESEGE